MIIVKIKAGLGNQMFQYAFGKSLSLRTGGPLKLDISAYHVKDYVTLQNETKRIFLLDKFNIQAAITSPAEIARYNPLWRKVARKIQGKIFGHPNGYAFDKKNLVPRKNAYYEGFWQSEKYFADIAETLRHDFTLKAPFGTGGRSVMEKITNVRKRGKVPVSLHVRRSDYVSMKVNADFFGTCNLEYYKLAYAEIQKRVGQGGNDTDAVELFVFSDDIAWAKNNLSFPSPMHFISGPAIADYEELVLMSYCDHHIIANSSFSWWGAWLNPNPKKTVIAPARWIKDLSVDTADVVPAAWIKISA